MLRVSGDFITAKGTTLYSFEIVVLYKKVFLVGLILILFTRSRLWVKLVFVLILSMGHVLVVSAYTIHNALFKAAGIQSNVTGIFPGIAFYLVCIVLGIWYCINRYRWEMPQKLLEKKLPDIIILMVVYASLICALELFDFRILIQFILGTSKLILHVLGYSVNFTDNVLAGDYGSVSLNRQCLGLVTIFVFAAIVYISTTIKRKALIYILIGVIGLNFLNVLRIVLLFVHLQKNGNYMLTMDNHDIYNYVIYGIIFILWIVWFEFYYPRKAKSNHTSNK